MLPSSNPIVQIDRHCGQTKEWRAGKQYEAREGGSERRPDTACPLEKVHGEHHRVVSKQIGHLALWFDGCDDLVGARSG